MCVSEKVFVDIYMTECLMCPFYVRQRESSRQNISNIHLSSNSDIARHLPNIDTQNIARTFRARITRVSDTRYIDTPGVSSISVGRMDYICVYFITYLKIINFGLK